MTGCGGAQLVKSGVSGRVSLGGGVIHVAKHKWVEGAAIAKALRQDTWCISRAAGSEVGSRERQGREVTEHSPCWAWGLQGGFGQCQDWKPLTCADP